MKSTKEHLPPHIVAGTNFNVERFDELYQWIEAKGADHTYLGQKSYGLLCNVQGKSAFELSLDGDELTLHQCLALAKNGLLIGIHSDHLQEVKLSLNRDQFPANERVHIYMVVELAGKRCPIGQPTPGEIPTRPPFSALAIHLELHQELLNDSLDKVLKIGEVTLEAGTPQLLPFLPPCFHCGAHPKLWNTISNQISQLKDFYFGLINVIQSIDTAREDSIIVTFKNFCAEIARFLSQRSPRLKRVHTLTHLIEYYEIIQSLAARINFEWEINHQHTGLLELIEFNIQKSTNHFEIKPVRDLIEHKFSPLNNNDSLQLIDQFCQEFIQPIIGMSKQSKIMSIQKNNTWQSEAPKRNLW